MQRGSVEWEPGPVIEDAALSNPLQNGWVLFPHQRDAVEQIVRRRRVILAFDMGLGKTLISLVAARAIQRATGCAVTVLCPISVAGGWAMEASAVGVDIEIHSWGKVPAPSKGGHYMLICDEAHYMQNMSAKRTKAALELAAVAGVLVLATGTPAKNAKPSNIFPLLVAVCHPLGQDWKAFERQYCGDDPNLQELHDRIGPCMLRKTKKECLDLPPKVRHLTDIDVPVELQQSYLALLDQARQQQQHAGEMASKTVDLTVEPSDGADDTVKQPSVGQAAARADFSARGQLFRLRNVASSAKAAAAIEMAEGLLRTGMSVVVVTCFKASAKLIHAELTARGLVEAASATGSGWSCELLTGEVAQGERSQMVQRYAERGGGFVFTCGAGGIGITLTIASRVIMVDRALTPGDVEQAEGTDRQCTVGSVYPNVTIFITMQTLTSSPAPGLCRSSVSHRAGQARGGALVKRV
jgi:SNF2 family DNA or RNA helicase